MSMNSNIESFHQVRVSSMGYCLRETCSMHISISQISLFLLVNWLNLVF